MNFLKRYAPYLIAGAVAAAAIPAGVFWYSGQQSSSRELLTGMSHDSKSYFNRQAQTDLTYPAAANKYVSCLMQEAAGNITCSTEAGNVTLNVTGSPAYSLHTNIPRSGGFTQQAIGYNGTNSFHQATDAGVGDQTTNNFSVSFWLISYGNPAASQRLIAKRSGAIGFEIYASTDGTGTLGYFLGDAGGFNATNGVCSAVLNIPGIHFMTLSFRRDGVLSCYRNGISGGGGDAINARSGSITNAAMLTIGATSGGASFLNAGIAGLIISNGETTLAEHTAMYKAFKVPTGVTFTQTTATKYPLPSVPGFGERLGIYAAGQWPVMYSANLVNTGNNPLGLGFPAYKARTNIVGYPNEISSWSTWAAGGAVTLTADTTEAPDGSMTADSIAWPDGFSASVYKNAVGAGNYAAGDYVCGSAYIKRISGTCTTVTMTAGTGLLLGSIAALSSSWQRLSGCAQATVTAKTPMFTRDPVANPCVIAISDVSLVVNGSRDRLSGSPPCTACVGNVNCTCNASQYSQSWATKTTYMPNALERLEGTAAVAIAPEVHDSTTKRQVWSLGNIAELNEGIQPSFLVKNIGGGPTAVAKGKPLEILAERREYRAGYDSRDGQTNTNPRKYTGFSMKINSGSYYYQPIVLENKLLTASIDQFTPAEQKGLYASNFYVGGTTSTDGLDGVIESANLYARPAMVVETSDPNLVTSLDFTGPAYMQNASIPRLSCLGASAANCWIWDMGEYGGAIYDRINGISLAAASNVSYQNFSGLIARGQGRRGINFDGSTEYIRAANTTINNLGLSSVVTFEAVIDGNIRSTAAANVILDTNKYTASTGGYILYESIAKAVQFIIDKDGLGNRVTLASNDSLTDGIHYIAVVATWDGTKWNPVLYVDGVPWAATVNHFGAESATITNTNAFTIGASAAGTNFFSSSIYEVSITKKAYSAGEILARYKQLVQQGTYFSDDATTVAHYKLNEHAVTNGVGIKDNFSSNHLTVVAGSPDPQYQPLPWPGGSGLVKPAIGYSGAYTSYHSGGTAIQITQGTDFSYGAWARHTGSTASDDMIIYKGGVSRFESGITAATGIPRCAIVDKAAASVTKSWATSINDDRFHLVLCKVHYTDALHCVVSISVDGANFIDSAVSSCEIDPNASPIYVGYIGSASNSEQLSGLGIWNSYALTNADAVTLYGSANNDPTGAGITYTRTSTGAKGVCYDTVNDPIKGLQVTCFGDNKVPYAYLSSATSIPGNERMGLMLPAHSALTNTTWFSEDVNDGVNYSCNKNTIVSNTAISPDGSSTAESVETQADNVIHYCLSNIGNAVTLAQNEYADWSIYVKKAGTSGTYLGVATYSGAADAYSRINVNLNTGAIIRTCNDDAARMTVVSSSIQGAANGWLRVSMRTQCQAVGGCTPVYGQWAIMNTDAAVCNESFAGTANHKIYIWGKQLIKNYSSALPAPYCPALAGANQTCNAPTALYLPAASIAGWTRAQGVINTISYYSLATGRVFDLYNAANDNGRIFSTTGADILYLYNDSAVLQQRLAVTSNNLGVLNGQTTVFDSASAFYNTTRRAYAGMFSSTYAGPAPTYTTDTSSAWSPATGTNLYLGNVNGASYIDGYLGNVSIWGAR